MIPTILNEEPPDGERLHTITMRGMQRNEIEDWLRKRGISKAYIWSNEHGRVLSYFSEDKTATLQKEIN